MARLRAEAKRHGRSLEAEVREILESAATRGTQREAAIALVTDLRERLEREGRFFIDSAELIRQERDRTA